MLLSGSPVTPDPLMIDTDTARSLPRRIAAWVRGNWASIVGNLFALAILAVAIMTLQSLSFSQLIAHVPRSPWFWLAFLIFYGSGPVAEWLIFRRLWAIPVSGIIPLLRKQFINEMLLGYSGEVYFYAWARRHATLVAAPFGAIKDVAILSAVVGNLSTIALVVVTAPLIIPFMTQHQFGLSGAMLGWSVAFVLVTTFGPLIFHRRVFGLPRADAWYAGQVHLWRSLLQTALIALMWHLALPDQPLIWWLLLAVWRQLLSRLPFIPNKDVVFAAVAVFIVGPATMIAAMVAMVAGITLAAHLLVGLYLVADHIFSKGRV